MACGSEAWNKEEPRTAWVKTGLRNKGRSEATTGAENQELEPKWRITGKIKQDSERRLRKAIEQEAESVVIS